MNLRHVGIQKCELARVEHISKNEIPLNLLSIESK